MINTLKDPKFNTNRQVELDITKGIAVFCMIAVHVLGSLALERTSHTIYGGIIEFLGTLPAAPVFMFTLGTGMVYSKSNNCKATLRRGGQIFLLGYLLNMLRTGILFTPLFLNGTWVSKLPYLVEGLTNVDILQFAGLSMIFLGYLKKQDKSLSKLVRISAIICVLNFILLNFKTENYVLSAITGLFWGSNSWSAFPFATWFFYPAAGYFFGHLLIRQTNKNIFYKYILIGSTLSLILLSALALLFNLNTGLMTETEYYHHTLYSNLLYTSFVLAWIAAWFYISKKLPSCVTITLTRWSTHVNAIYCIHWVLISILTVIAGYQQMNDLSFWISFLSILIISDFTAYYKASLSQNKRFLNSK